MSRPMRMLLCKPFSRNMCADMAWPDDRPAAGRPALAPRSAACAGVGGPRLLPAGPVGRDVHAVAAGTAVAVPARGVLGEVHEYLLACGRRAAANPADLAGHHEPGEPHGKVR